MTWRLDLQTKTRCNIRKAFKYNKRFLRSKKTESGTKRAIFFLGKYYSSGASRFNFRPSFFLIYINNSSKNLSSNPKLLADDTSLFSVVHNLNTSTNILNEDVKKINDWATQWKMSFNLEVTKQAQEVIFSCKIKKPLHTPRNFNNKNVKQTAF